MNNLDRVEGVRPSLFESSDPARLAALRPEWDELFQAGGGGNPFLSWEWQFTFWRTFARRRPLRLLEARDQGGRLVGLLALCARAALGSPRRWCLLGNGIAGADGLDVLARPGFGAPVREAMAQALAAGLPAWDFLDLEDLPCGSATVAALRSALRPRGVRVSLEPAYVCPGFALRGDFEGHLARFRRRETYQRRLRWLERQPGFRIEVATTEEEAGPAMEDLLRLHHLRWDAEGGSAGIPRGVVEEFHRELAPLLARRRWLRLYRLFVAGRSVAAIYGLELAGRFYYYQSGMDPSWATRSPGLVLLGKTVQDAYARRLTDYDFLRGTEPHKLDWASDRRETCNLRLRAPGIRAEAGAAAEEVFRRARDAARAIAPDGVWRRLQRVRRNVAVNAMARPERGAAPDVPPGRHGGRREELRPVSEVGRERGLEV